MTARIYPFARTEQQAEMTPVAIWWAWAMWWPAFFMPAKKINTVKSAT